MECSMFPNECRPYLPGVVGRGAQLKFLLRAGMLPVGRLEPEQEAAAGCCVMVALSTTLRTLCSRAVHALHAVRD